MSHLQVVNGFMAAFKPIRSFVHEFVSFTREVQSLTLCRPTFTHTHKLTYTCKWLLIRCVSPEKRVRDQKHHSDPVPAQLDSVWAGRHVSAGQRVRRPRAAKVQCDERGGLVQAGGDACVREVFAKLWGPASKHQTCLPPIVVSPDKIIEFPFYPV